LSAPRVSATIALDRAYGSGLPPVLMS